MEKNENMLSIGDVARFLNIPTHTIRYWEKEFKDFLSPSRTIGHQRRYTDEDVKKIRDIMRLLKHEGYSNGVPEEVAQRILEIIKEQLNVNEAKSIVA